MKNNIDNNRMCDESIVVFQSLTKNKEKFKSLNVAFIDRFGFPEVKC